ncbi:MAG: DUF1801 domain-containing protein [Akkermansiaceae bacterium]|nr:DUF1801 domain-containing protein [Akkermansiaceae bacterium]NNM30466.1 DUF1801 domain-containing protein [Akkermansiaceae bacterium]
MKADSSVTTPTAYLKQVPTDRRKAIETVHQAIKKAAPTLRSHVANGMLAYGPTRTATKSGTVSIGYVVGLANQRHYMSAYICCTVNGKYLPEAYAKDLGKVNCGKSCIRFRQLDDLNLAVFLKLVKLAADLHRQGQ